jgi:large subunit ribosomal protein L1
MPQSGKKFRAAAAKVDRNKRYTIAEGFTVLKDAATTRATKFDQTVEVAINLGVDPKHADQMVRGAVVLPHGTGATVRVAVFAKGEKANEAEALAPTWSAATTSPSASRAASSTSTPSSPPRT